MLLHIDRQPVPRRALAISIGALVLPVTAAFWFPDATSSGAGMLIWLCALIPAFLLSYYRGLPGVATALAGGMAVITATQVSLVGFSIADPDWKLLGVIVGVYLAVSVGVAVLSEMLRGERLAAEQMALIDPLTLLPNRRYADMVLEQEFAAAARGADLVVIVFDLDHFKAVNDVHGHSAGDGVLRDFAGVLRANTRRENLTARFGGEEFISILRNADEESALVFAERVLSDTRALVLPWEGKQTVSAGLASFEPGMGSYELLLAAVDNALYKAKEGGRDMISVAPRRHERASATPMTNPPQRVSAPIPIQAVIQLQTSAATPPAQPLIYVVDDDTAVRTVLRRVLVSAGFRTWDTGDPQTAIQCFADTQPAERPDVILADVIMPAMTGTRMIEQIAKIDPKVKVIYMSGYVHSEISYSGTPGSEVAFLGKPITPDRLIAAVQRMVGAAVT
jgi:diguanylate cyclase (GGDEF)-like protein